MKKSRSAGKPSAKPVAKRVVSASAADRLASSGRLASPASLHLETVRDLAQIAREFDLEEVEVRPSGRIRVRRRTDSGGEALSAAPARAPGSVSAPAPLSLVSSAEPAADAGLSITSPFVGTFYTAPSPEAAPYVEVGQIVRKGQVVCIVEAMKLMNEIESEVDGRVVEVLAKSGAHVEYGQALFRLAKP
jgi:acetyl-CoA carboxylase biotin carboxyl carrier protein